MQRGRGIVIRVIRLEGLESAPDHAGNEAVIAQQPRMRQGGEPSRGRDVCNHLRDRGGLPGNEPGPTRCQPLPERLVNVGHVTSPNQQPRDVRPPDGPAPLGLRLQEQGADVDGHAQLGEPHAELADPMQAGFPLGEEEGCKTGRSWIETIPQHVDVAPILDRSDLDARHPAKPGARCGIGHRGQGCHGIVVGDRKDPDPGTRHMPDEVVRRIETIRGAGVKVEIDQGRPRRRRPAMGIGRLRGATRLGRGPASARYS